MSLRAGPRLNAYCRQLTADVSAVVQADNLFMLFENLLTAPDFVNMDSLQIAAAVRALGNHYEDAAARVVLFNITGRLIIRFALDNPTPADG